MQTLQLGLVKLSFLFLFKAVFATGKGSTFGIVSWAMIGLITAWTIAFFFGFLFACGTHIDAWWNVAIGNKICLGLNYENGFAFSDFLLDLFIIIMPVPMV